MIFHMAENQGAEGSDPSTDPPPVQEPDYEVGYRKPPKQHCFKPGVSGNPKGRQNSKRIDDIRDLTDKILEESVQIRDGNRVKKVSSLEAALRSYRREALSGKPKAALNFFRLAEKAGMLSKLPRQSFVKLMEPGGDDGKVIRLFRLEQEELARSGTKAAEESD
jgi:hypothetical protein